MKKFIRIFFVNLLLFIFLIFTVELIIWGCENENLKRRHDEYRAKGLLKFHPGVTTFKLNPEFFPTPENNFGRAPEGLEFSGKPIVFFGCSFTYGFTLDKNQTLPYKFAYTAKRPAYNRALHSWGIQHMLYQTYLERMYEQIPEPEFVIYTYMHDHIRRLYLLTFLSEHMLNEDFNLRYKEKNGKLIEITNSNPILRFIKRLYITNEIHYFYVNNFILRKSNYKNCYNFALMHFIASKEEMQKHWKNTKYVVFFYDDSYDDSEFKQKLEDNGFMVVNYYDLTNEDLTSPKYMKSNFHPNEAAWDLLVPALIKKLNL